MVNKLTDEEVMDKLLGISPRERAAVVSLIMGLNQGETVPGDREKIKELGGFKTSNAFTSALFMARKKMNGERKLASKKKALAAMPKPSSSAEQAEEEEEQEEEERKVEEEEVVASSSAQPTEGEAVPATGAAPAAGRSSRSKDDPIWDVLDPLLHDQ